MFLLRKDISGDDIARHFDEKEVGDVDVLSGMMQGYCFFLLAMKELDYILSIRAFLHLHRDW